MNFEEINQAIDRMKKSLMHDGYIHAESQTLRRMDDAAKTVGLVVKLTKGAQYHYGKMTIKGLDLNGEAQIQKLWVAKPGKAYNPEYPDYFLTRIKEQGLFDDLGDMKAIKKVDDENHIVDITLEFKASPVKPDRRRERQPGSPF